MALCLACSVLPVFGGQSLLQQSRAGQIEEVLLRRLLLESLLLPQGTVVLAHTAIDRAPAENETLLRLLLHSIVLSSEYYLIVV